MGLDGLVSVSALSDAKPGEVKPRTPVPIKDMLKRQRHKTEKYTSVREEFIYLSDPPH
jgi:hypothetical protein